MLDHIGYVQALKALELSQSVNARCYYPEPTAHNFPDTSLQKVHKPKRTGLDSQSYVEKFYTCTLCVFHA